MARKSRTLELFQSEYTNQIEETFARTFSEKEDVRVYFVNENSAFTDGKNIVLDPAINDLYKDRDSVRRAELKMNLPNLISRDSFSILKVITRGLNIHECLHLLYSDFPPRAVSDKEFTGRNEREYLALIANIIEDSYIESVGASVYDNINYYLKMLRLSMFYSAEKEREAQSAPTLFDWTNEELLSENERKNLLLRSILSYITDILLYPFKDYEKPEGKVKEYADRVKDLFFEGSIAASPDARHEHARRILRELKELVPDDSFRSSDTIEDINEKLSGSPTHQKSMRRSPSKGKEREVSRRLFRADGEFEKADKYREADETDVRDLKEIADEIKDLKDFLKKTLSGTNIMKVIEGEEYKGAVNHRGVKINESRRGINYKNRNEYMKIAERFRSSINTYSQGFSNLLVADTLTRENKVLFGSGIDSKRLSDPKKRYWYRNVTEPDVPDISVLLLVDGSGSMIGKKTRYTVLSSVILHEVLKRQDISHAIVEHRGNLKNNDEIDVNVLLDFDAPSDAKYNILDISAESDNRDGLALLWAERYINSRTQNEHRLIIVLSDGYPLHMYDSYFPEKSVMDTKKIVEDIKKRGTGVIGISLDVKAFSDTLKYLKMIYPDLIECKDLRKLTGQILTRISEVLKNN